jgi:preprotein translocase subunit SecF
MLIKYWPERTNVPFMNMRIAGALFSMILIAASAFLLGTRGLNFRRRFRRRYGHGTGQDR